MKILECTRGKSKENADKLFELLALGNNEKEEKTKKMKKIQTHCRPRKV
eukprot:UN04868